MPEYRYELRRGTDIVTTDHLSHERPLETAQQLTISSQPGIVHTIAPILGEREPHLIVELERDDRTSD